MAFVTHHIPSTHAAGCLRDGLQKPSQKTAPRCVIDAFNKLTIDADLDNPIATGSFGDVFFGTIDRTKEQVVLKRARNTPNARALFSAEKRINRKLANGNDDFQLNARWPEYLGDYVRDSESFIVWRKCGDGCTLQDYLSGKPMSALCAAFNVSYNPSRAIQTQLFCRVMRSTLLALKEVNQNNVVHRDVKPSNMLVVPSSNPDNTIRLIDFGSACDVSALLWWTRGINTIDPLYGAPEQRLNVVQPTKFDLFSAGLVGISVLMPAFSTQSRLSEFRNTLQALDYDLLRYRKSWMDAQKNRSVTRMAYNCDDADVQLAALFHENNSILFNLLCSLLKKSPADRSSMESALYTVSSPTINI